MTLPFPGQQTPRGGEVLVERVWLRPGQREAGCSCKGHSRGFQNESWLQVYRGGSTRGRLFRHKMQSQVSFLSLILHQKTAGREMRFHEVRDSLVTAVLCSHLASFLCIYEKALCVTGWPAVCIPGNIWDLCFTLSFPTVSNLKSQRADLHYLLFNQI